MNINNYFKKYFKDSYGFDRFSQYLLIIGLLFMFSRRIQSIILGIAIIGYALWRALSKNKYKRQLEESGFSNLLSIINIKLRKFRFQITDSLKFKVLTCPNCSQKLRVPRRKGKIVVNCKKCHKEFKARS